MKVINLKNIYSPINKELQMFEKELSKVVDTLGSDSSKKIFLHLFKVQGKRLRPALLLLSAKAAKQDLSVDEENKIIKLAVAMELIHSASLIHDDVIDEDKTRRGQDTLNNVFGNKIAVLAGDVLNTKASLIIASIIHDEFQIRTSKLVEKMCLAEIEQLTNEYSPDGNKYLEIIESKTALFMELCCWLGASTAGANKDETSALSEYGLNFGMTYQIIDDYIDNDEVALKFVSLNDADNYANIAKNSISTLAESIYREKLIDFLDYILELAK